MARGCVPTTATRYRNPEPKSDRRVAHRVCVSSEIWLSTMLPDANPVPPPPPSHHSTDAQNLVKQYEFYMKRALVRARRSTQTRSVLLTFLFLVTSLSRRHTPVRLL